MFKHRALIPSYSKDTLGWQVVGNLELDWLIISRILSIIIFLTTSSAIFVWLFRFRPEALKSKKKNVETTYDWKLIGEVIMHSSTFSGGIIILLNVLVFMFTGIWSIDAKSMIVLVVAFALMIFRSLDKFLTGLGRGYC